MTPSLPPPPVQLAGRLAVPVDMHQVTASVRFDVASQTAEVSATVELTLDGPTGCPVFDLRQEIDAAMLDGRPLPPEALGHADMGAGNEARMRVVDVACEGGSSHVLSMRYRLSTPEATGALPVDWSPSGDGVSWDLFMSDLEPGRYLEMWLPANLCHDRLSVELEVEVAGTARPHVLLANGAAVERTPGYGWSVRYPATFTSLSPLLVLSPSDQVKAQQTAVDAGGRETRVRVARVDGAGADLHDLTADIAAWLSYFTERYGAWAHGDDFLAVIWDLPRGMEYDGATTACEPAIEHEVFHSWFGRGVKPACAADGWIDEAMATWATASRRATVGRFAVEELGLDEPPSLLYPAHPWSRHTPREAYAAGGRLMSGLAYMAGGAAQLRSALAAWHKDHSGGPATSRQLAAHLGSWCGRDLAPWWDRYVHGAASSS
jgi:hypothetical protein